MKNPYSGKVVKNKIVAWIDPKQCNMSIVGMTEGNMTDFQLKSEDVFISRGYARVDDPEVVAQLQRGVAATASFTSQEQWEAWFKQVGAMVESPTEEEMAAAAERVAQYEAYREYAKPVEK